MKYLRRLRQISGSSQAGYSTISGRNFGIRPCQISKFGHGLLNYPVSGLSSQKSIADPFLINIFLLSNFLIQRNLNLTNLSEICHIWNDQWSFTKKNVGYLDSLSGLSSTVSNGVHNPEYLKWKNIALYKTKRERDIKIWYLTSVLKPPLWQRHNIS